MADKSKDLDRYRTNLIIIIVVMAVCGLIIIFERVFLEYWMNAEVNLIINF